MTPEHVNKKYLDYIEYLKKAAEIIRRDHYCHAVEFVEFSPEKSTAENPVEINGVRVIDLTIVSHFL